jgi:WD40 repeat protein
MKPLTTDDNNRVVLPHGPQDTLTSLRFASRDSPSASSQNGQDLLAVTSWDKTLRLYSTTPSGQPLLVHKEETRAALFDASFSCDGETVFFGGLDRQLAR